MPIPNVLAEDEEYNRYKKDKLRTLKPAFKEGGSVTAGNSSKLNDGACAMGTLTAYLVLMSEEKMLQLGLKPLARIVSYADAEI